MNIPQDKAHWLVVWIAFEGLVSRIRPFVEQSVKSTYQSLRSSHNIHVRTWPPLNSPNRLYYENINGNINRRLPSGEFDFSKFDYKVTNHVDFAKLHVEPAMAKFSAFDGKCDGSAVLSLLSEVLMFSPTIQSSAKLVKSRVRNVLAHPCVTDWKAGKFMSCFQKMQQLVQSMCLPPADTKTILSELNDWKTKGIAFCGNSLKDPTLLSLVYNEVLELSTKLDKFVCPYKEQKDLLESQFLEVKQSLEKLLEFTQKLGGGNELETPTQRVENRNCMSVKLQESAKPPFFGALDQNDFFTGRKNELENLEKAFGDADTVVRGVAGRKANIHGICGLGGCGKSSLAFEYAWREIKSYPGGIFVVNGESDDLMRASLQGIHGEFVHNTQLSQHEKANKFEQLLTETLSWLGNLKDKWLLLVDNMDQKELSPCTQKIFFGQWKNKTLGNILVTSRRSCQALCEDLNLSSENVFELDAFSLDESIEFLKKRMGSTSSCGSQNQGERELAQELGGLPLALEQAAAYIKAVKCPIQSYLQQYRSQPLMLLNNKTAKPCSEICNQARLAVQTTWLLNFSYIKNDEKDPGLGKAATFFMKIAAYLSPDEIPIDILNVGAPEVKHKDLKDRLKMPIGAEQIVDLLIRFSLFKRKLDDTLSIHRLVQETLRDLCDGEGETDEVVSSAMRMLHRSFLDCVGGADFLHDFREKLSVNAFYLVCNLMRDSFLKPAFFCEESARIFGEAAFFSYSQGMQSQGYRLQQVVFEILCAMKEPIDFDKDERMKAMRILGPPLLPNKLVKVINKTDNETDIPVDANQSDRLLEMIKVIEPRAIEAFSRRDFQTSVNLCSEIVKASNFSINPGTVKVNQPYLVPLGEILCCRGIAHVQMANFETAVDDFNVSTYADIQCYRGYYWKTYALCKLVENGRNEFTSRAQAAAAVLHYKFSDSKTTDIQKLQKTFPGLLDGIEGRYKFVSHVNELKELENGPSRSQNDFTKDSLTIILDDGDYVLKEVAILGGCYYFVGLPGGSVSLKCRKGLYLSHGSFLFENIQFKDPCLFLNQSLSSAVASCTTQSEMLLAITLGRAQQTKMEVTAGTERKLSALIEADDINSLVINHCSFTGSTGCRCSGIIVKTTEYYHEQIIVSVRSSIISRFRGSGFKLQGDTDDCSIRIYDNELKRSTYGIVIDSPSCFYMEENKIFNNLLSGIAATRSCNGELLRNYVVGNGMHGILLNESSAIMMDNVISSNRGWGIVCCFETNLRCHENELQNNQCGGLRIILNGAGNVSIQRCEFTENSGPAVFPTAANKRSPVELEWEQLTITKSREDIILYPFSFLLRFLEPTEFQLCKSIGEFKPPSCDDLRVSEVSNMLFHCEKKICSKCWKHLQLDSDLVKCPSCHIALYCSNQCSNMDIAGHSSVCESILEANKLVLKGDVDEVWPLTNPELPVQDGHQNKAGISPCVICTFTPSPECVEYLCLLTCPQRNVYTALSSFKIRDLTFVHGSHIPNYMTDVKAASILANFDSESGDITIYKHQIYPLDNVPDGLSWVKKTLFAFVEKLMLLNEPTS